MSTVTLTTPTYTQVLAPAVVATGNVGTVNTLDLKTKRGAILIVRIGRRNGTALTRSGYVAVRRNDNDALVVPNTNRDCLIPLGASIGSQTVSSGGGTGATTVTLGANTNFAVGDTICLASDDSSANRVEFARIVAIATNTLTLERAFRTTHNAADRVTTQAEVFEVFLPGGDIYEITAVNNSGQDLIFAVDAIIDNGDTIT